MYAYTNTTFDYWNSSLLEWMKEEGHGIFLKYVQDEQTTPAGYLLYTHKASNTLWYQTALSKKSSILISARFRKISGQNIKDRLAVHLEWARDHHEQVKEFLRSHCSKNSKSPYHARVPVIFIPDKMHLSNKHLITTICSCIKNI